MIVTIPEPQRVRKVGDNLVVTIPADVAERSGLKADDLVSIQLTVLDVVPRLSPELRRAADEVWATDEAALRYLADR